MLFVPLKEEMRIFAVILLLFLSGAVFGQNLQKDPVKVYPNPATEYINIVIENSERGTAQISIHSIIGNKVKVEIDNISSGIYRANVKDLPQGYYLVVVKDPKREINSTIKFLKK